MSDYTETTKHYCLKTGPSYKLISNWLQRKSKTRKAKIVGSCQIQTECIKPVPKRRSSVALSIEPGSNDEPHWKRHHDFSRRIATVARYYVLRAGGLTKYIDDGLELKNPPNLRNEPQVSGININDGNHLASNLIEVRWIVAHFDMLVPHFHIENIINAKDENVPFGITSEMIIIDHHFYKAWHITSVLSITNEGQHCIGDSARRVWHFISDVQVMVNRYHFEKEEYFQDYYFMPSTPELPQDDDEEDDSEEENDLTARVQSIAISKK
uniref:Uncharacterized protein n=1 Tax=Amphimedon queenslandica TaxID=400682 RepID=A0A1X7SLC5_AMPQE